MTTFVLVHGAWHGGWCWREVRRHLAADRCEVFTPTLTGLGERAHLATPEIGLDTHVQDVIGVLECEDLEDVVLVGHSYAGVVITAVAARAAQRLSCLIYLDAQVPKNGMSLVDSLSAAGRARFETLAGSAGEGWLLPPLGAGSLGLTRDADVQSVMPRLVPQPFKTFTDKLVYDAAAMANLPRAYINCIKDNPPGGPRSPNAEGMDYYELQTGHDAMVTEPDKVAQLFREISRAYGA